MEKDNLKNIVVLKNLPSNIVDEAIVILKSNKKIKKVEVIDKNSNIIKKENTENRYILKEAEMVISNYISKLETKDTNLNENNKLKQRYNILKKYAFLTSTILLLSVMLHFI